MNTNKVPTRQLIGFLIVARLSFSISNIIALNLPPYNQDQWIMILVSTIYIIIVSSPLLYLTNKFKSYTLVGSMKMIFGNYIGNALGMLYGLYFITSAVNVLTLQAELVTASILAETHITIVTGVMIITCMYLASRGITTILRAVDLFFPIIMLTLLTLFILGYKNINFSIFLPILKDTSLFDINKGAMMLSTIYLDIFIIAMLVPNLEKKDDVNKIFFIGIYANAFVIIMASIATQGALGIEYARHSVFPFLIYTRLISVSQVIERIDAIFVVTWLIAITVRITIYLYIAASAFREVFNKDENDKVILIIVGILTFIISSSIDLRRPVVGIRKDFNIYLAILFIIFIIIIPIISCIVYLIRRKAIEDENKMS